MAELAIGAISLGIQVCKGLVKYCRAVSKRSKDIEDITAQIQALESTFRALDSILPRVTLLPSFDRTAVASAIACAESCEGGVKELQKFLDSISDSARDGDVKGKMKDVGRKLAFGFQQDEVASLQQKVQGLTTTAGNALQALNLDFGLKNGENIADLSSAMSAQLYLVKTGMASTSTAVLTAVETARRDTSTGLSLVSQNMESVDNRLAPLEKLVLSQIELARPQGPSPVSGAQLLARPAMLREACDVINLSSAGGFSTGPSRHQRMVLSRCGCDLRERPSSVVRRDIFAGRTLLSDEYEETSRHLPNCPLYKTSKSQKRVSARLTVSIWSRISVLVQASLTCTTGAGGVSISPQLGFRMIVRLDGPAARAILDAFGPARPRSDTDMANSFAIAERQILSPISHGEGVATRPVRRWIEHTIRTFEPLLMRLYAIREHLPGDMSQVRRLVEALVDAGVPCDEVDVTRRGPIDELLCNNRFISGIAPRNWRMRVELTHTMARISSDNLAMNPTYFALDTLHTLTENPEIGHYLDLSPLAMAILNKSEENVRSIIAKHPHSISERISGTTVLHLSCRWPAGLSILLSAGAADLVDEQGHNGFFHCTAVDLAIFFSCVEAVALLFDVGCSWNGFHSELDLATVSLRCVRLVACKLAYRRQHLLCLAEETLTQSRLSDIHCESGVLDAKALRAVTLLLEAAVDLPAYLAVPDGYETIYLFGNLDITHIPIFFENGFHDANHAAQQHWAPIQAVRWDVYRWGNEDLIKDPFAPDLVGWLESHGFLDISPADAQPSGMDVSATGHHILAISLICMGWITPLRHEVVIPMALPLPLAVAPDILACQTADCCRCACSSAGCLPLTINLKTAANQTWGVDSQILLWEAVWDDMAGELLRFLTFEALEMTHTCCTYEWQYRHPTATRHGPIPINTLQAFRGSVNEIQDEEEELHALLEQLLQEFEVKLAKSIEGLRGFVWGYWRRRMGEECAPVLGEGRAGWDELGVKLEEKYETPGRLRNLLGWNFDLNGGCSSSRGSDGSPVDQAVVSP